MPDYLITTKIPGNKLDADASRERIVRAKNQAQAIKHVVADTLTCEVASIDDAMALARTGGMVELAKEDA